MIDMLSIRQKTMCAPWLTARLSAAHGSLNPERWLISAAFNVVVGILAYLGLAAITGVPVWAIVAFTIVASAAWWFLCRLAELTEERRPKLRFFTWEKEPLRLSEDVISSKVVYCIGLTNEGATTVRNVRVNIDAVEGYARPTIPARLPIFRTADDNADLHAGESEYFCVTRIVSSPSDNDGTANICCHNDLMKSAFPLQELVNGRTIAVSAYGDGTPKTTRRIRISSKQEAAIWSLDLKLLPDGDGAPTPLEQRPVPSQPRAEVDLKPPPGRNEAPTPVEQRPVPSQPRAEGSQALSEGVRRLLARQV